MKIRKASEKDIKVCLAIKGPETREIDHIFKTNFIREIKNDLYLVLVAEINRKVIGFITGRKDAWNKMFYIEQLYIDQKQTSKGYGSKLLSEVIKRAKKSKLRIIFLDLPPQNKEAMKFYLRNGFQKSGQIKGFYNNPKKPNAVVLSYKL